MKNKRNQNQNSKIQTPKFHLPTLTSHHSGITLIALVVTVVVLLILAGVTITLMFGENNIFDLAKDAADKTNDAIKSEQDMVDKITSELDKWSNSGGSEENPEKPKVADLVGKLVDNTKNIKAEDKNKKPITIPAGFTVLAHGTDGVEYNHDATNHTPCVEDGIVVQDSSDNQFVWVPVDSVAYAKMIDETNNRGNLYNFGSYNSTTKTYTPYTSPQLKDYSATGYREPDTVTSYTSGSTTYNGDEVESNYTQTGIEATDKDSFGRLLQSEFNAMASSVKEHKGFYIGRYETGNLQAVKNTTPVVQRGNTNISGVNWYYMYANSKNIAKNDKYTSSMIWGCQWDMVLEWIIDTNRTAEGNKDYSLVTDSSSWGNYKDQTFPYTVKTETGTKTETKAENTSTRIPTGSAERTKKNNIYDMAGNIYELTIEAYGTDGRIRRRGRLQRCKL